MADRGTVCSMCGDVGFPDKLFQCLRCLSRFQHSYCSNYYELEPSETAGVCDWCLSKEQSGARHGPSSKKHAQMRDSGSAHHRSGDSNDDKLKRNSDHEESTARGKSSGSSSSSKPAGRRYKLLKDVLC